MVRAVTGRVEVEPARGEGRQPVGAALHRVRRRLSMALWGLRTDNGGDGRQHHR